MGFDEGLIKESVLGKGFVYRVFMCIILNFFVSFYFFRINNQILNYQINSYDYFYSF